VTESGRNVLFGRSRATLAVIEREERVKGRERKKAVAKVSHAGTSAGEDDDLFEALRTLRRELASQEAIPPYIVMSDKVLHQIAVTRPTTIERFGEISGISEYKKNKYGKEFIKLIRSMV
jgi:ATP-dependent DNA helicase RecQ